MEIKTKAILTIVGAILIHLVLGSVYIWGNIAVYVTSFYRHEDGDGLTLEDTFIVFPIIIVASNTMVFIGSYLTIRFFPKVPICMGAWVLLAGVLISSFMTKFPLFAFFYGAFFGWGCGLSYMAPIISAWSYFPERKGLISGIIVGAFGLGSAIFNYVATFLVNPENKEADIERTEGDVTDHYYAYDVSSKVPAMLRWLDLMWFVLIFAGMSLVARLKDAESEEVDTKGEAPSITAVAKTRNFWILGGMIFLSSSGGLYMAAAYKLYGEENLSNDLELAAIGSTSSFFNGGFRLVFGWLHDWIGFRMSYTILLCAQIAAFATITYISSSFELYLIWVCVIMAWEGGHFVLYPSVWGKLFGKKMGSKVYSVIFINFGLTTIFTAMIQRFLIEDIGYHIMFLILAGMSAGALLILQLLFREKSQWYAPGYDNMLDKATAQNEDAKAVAINS